MEPVKTRLEVSGPLAARQMSGDFAPDVRSSNALLPTRFMVGVDSQGQVQHVFLQNSSGESAVDAFASRSVKALTFTRAEEPFAWGFITIAWGDDVLIIQESDQTSASTLQP